MAETLPENLSAMMISSSDQNRLEEEIKRISLQNLRSLNEKLYIDKYYDE